MGPLVPLVAKNDLSGLVENSLTNYDRLCGATCGPKGLIMIG